MDNEKTTLTIIALMAGLITLLAIHNANGDSSSPFTAANSYSNDAPLTAMYGNTKVCGDHLCVPGEWDRLQESLASNQFIHSLTPPGHIFNMPNNATVNITPSNMTTKIIPTNMTMQNNVTISSSQHLVKKREFWLYTEQISEINKTMSEMPSDVFYPPILIANTGDTVMIHFFNTESNLGEKHSFTMYDPYNIDVIVEPGQNKTISFNATSSGLFTFLCKFHQPNMQGQLLVENPYLISR